MKKILVIDNYDSFTYNLVHYLEDLDCEVTVYRNDEFDIDEIAHFDKILLSPGPGIPDEAGLLKVVIAKYAPTKSILGVCLGQQAIGEVFGGTLSNLDKVYHGVSSIVKTSVKDELLFEGLRPDLSRAGIYGNKQDEIRDLVVEKLYFSPEIVNVSVNLCMKYADVDGDGKVTEEEYIKWATDEQQISEYIDQF